MIDFSPAEKKFYSEQVIGGAKNRRGIVAELKGEFTFDFDLFDKGKIVDAYHSAFCFDESFKEFLTENHSVRGYDGNAYANYLFWDIDNEDLTKSLEDTLTLIERLESIGAEEDNIRLYLSGNKGFHVVLLSNDVALISGTPNTHKIVKHVCSELADGIESFDSSVYDKTRIIRVANSFNSKGGHYKVPISMFELKMLDIDNLMMIAENQREYEFTDEMSEIPYIAQSISEYDGEEERSSDLKVSANQLIESMMSGQTDVVGRNNLFTSIAGVLHSRNISDNMAFAMLSLMNSGLEKPLPGYELKSILDSVSKYGIKEEFKPVDAKDFITMRDAYDLWKILKENRTPIDVGMERISKELYTFDVGKVMYIAARPSIGKSLLGMHMVNKMARSLGETALFFSLEMTPSAIFYRAAQITSGSTERDQKTFSDYILTDEEMVEETFREWDSMLINDKSGLTITQIEAYCNAYIQVHGEIGPILIDYIGLMGGTDDYNGLSTVARELKNMAKRLNARVIVLVQLSRKAGDGTVEVQLNHLVDSGALEASADIILGMWRSSRDQFRIHTKMVKNRDGVANVYSDLIQAGMNYTNVEYDDTGEDSQKGGW